MHAITRMSTIAAAILLCGCSSQVEDAQREVDLIRNANANVSMGRAGDNAALCAAYSKLQKAYLEENNREGYERTRIHVVAYCG